MFRMPLFTVNGTVRVALFLLVLATLAALIVSFPSSVPVPTLRSSPSFVMVLVLFILILLVTSVVLDAFQSS